MVRISIPKAWRKEAGDTLIEVTMALSILSMVLISSTVIAAQAFRMGQTARERTAVSAAAQGQIESVRSFRDNSTWDVFLKGEAGATPYNGVTNAGNSGPNCKVVLPCFHMEGDGSKPTFRPMGDRIAGPVPTSFLETSVKGPTTASPNTVEVTVNYYFEGLGGGNFAGHITTTFTNLQYSAVPPPPPPAPPCFTGTNDIVLVMDTSLSMTLTLWSNGKFGDKVTQEAAQLFISTVQLSAAGNHVSVVGFNGSTPPKIYTPLVGGSYFTSKSATASADIAGLQYNQGTVYTQGLDAAQTVLATGRPGVNKVIIFMSDGRDTEYANGDYSLTTNDPLVQAKINSIQDLDDLYTVGTDSTQSDGLMLMPRGKGSFAIGTNPGALNAVYQTLASGLQACP